MTFSKSGNLMCGKPFPRQHLIRFVKRVFYQKDYNGANQDELDVMPSMNSIILFNSLLFSYLYIFNKYQHHIANSCIWM